MSAPRPSTFALGVAFYLAGVFLFALNDALGKWLVKDYSVGQLMLLRSIGAGVVLAPMIARWRVNVFDGGQIGLQLLRIVCMACDAFCFYFSTRSMPLADVMTFYMAAPLIVTALSAPVLGEKVEPFRWVAVCVGFIGVLIALQPSPEMFSRASPIALFGACTFALGQTITRKLRAKHWLPLVLWQFVGGGLIGLATVPFAWVAPPPSDLALMFLVGAVAMVCFVFITRALAMTPAATLAPFFYSSLLWATILGWIIWRDAPTPPIILGNAIIIAAGVFVAVKGRGRAAA